MKFLYALLLFVPIAIALEVLDIGGHSAVFVTSALGMVPLAALLGQATEQVAHYTGSRIGALLNATLGNAAELIITIVALREGGDAVGRARPCQNSKARRTLAAHIEARSYAPQDSHDPRGANRS